MRSVTDEERLTFEAELTRARRRIREALRRVNQDWAIYGAVERTNARALESARRHLAWLNAGTARA